MSTIQLTPGQRKFQQALTQRTGLNSRVIGAWILAEEGGANSGAARSREASHNHNWLNIGYFDSGPGAITKDQAFSTPESAAHATAQFLKGQKFGASSGIRRILSTVGQDPAAQMHAIATSGWASSGYNGGANLRALYQQAPAVSGNVSSTSSIAGLAAARGGAPKTTTVSNAADVAAASDKNRRIALVSDYLSKSDPGSPLLRSALLQPVAVPGLKTSTQTTPAGLPKASRIAAAVTQPRGGGKVQVEASANRQGVSIQKPILGFLHQLAGTMGRTVDVTTGTNHNQYVAGRPGVQSDHWTGNATDLGMGGDARQSPAVDKKGTLVAAHAIVLASQQAGKPIAFQQAYAMAHAGGLWNFQTKQGRVQILWKTMQGGDHYNHVHIGVNPGA